MGGRLDSVQTATNYTIDAALASGFAVAVENVGAAAITVTPPGGLAFQTGAANVSLPPGNVLVAVNVGGQYVIERLGPNYTPLIPDDANTVAHVFFDGKGIRDLYSNAWSMTGAVPQVPAVDGIVPPGAGPFSDSNYYSLGSGSDVLDFGGDFSAACIWHGPDNGTGDRYLFTNGAAGVSGYLAQVLASSGQTARVFFSVNNLQSPNTYIAGVVNVLCWGRSGSTGLVKLNGGALAQGALGAQTSGSAVVAAIGRRSGAGDEWADTFYEAWFAATTPSDGLFTAIAKRVKERLAITAW